MFSPETYALLIGKINGMNGDISSIDEDVTTLKSDVSTIGEKVTDLEEAMPQKFERKTFSLVSTQHNAIESSFSAASDKSLFSGTYTTNSYSLGWYGIKHNSSAGTKAFFFYSGSTGDIREAIGILTRDSTGAWTAERIV